MYSTTALGWPLLNINLTMNKQNLFYLKRRQHPIATTTTKIPAKIGRAIPSTSVCPLELGGSVLETSFVVLMALLLSVVISQPRGPMQYTFKLHYYQTCKISGTQCSLISCSPAQVTKSLDCLASHASRPQQFLSEPWSSRSSDLTSF